MLGRCRHLVRNSPFNSLEHHSSLVTFCCVWLKTVKSSEEEMFDIMFMETTNGLSYNLEADRKLLSVEHHLKKETEGKGEYIQPDA